MHGFHLLSRHNAERIHDASIRVLESTGIRIDPDDREIRELLLASGATPDGEDRLLLPPSLIEDAVGRAASAIRLFDRNGEPSFVLENGDTYFGPGSDALYNYDRETGRLFPTENYDSPRGSTIDDVRQNVRIADALGFDFMMSMGLPHELDAVTLYPSVFAEMIRNTSRPIVFTSTCVEEIEAIHDIASIVSESPDERPWFIAYLEPISPLRFDPTVTSRLSFCVRHGIPIVFAAGANCGGGAPITPEGGVVQGTAECLAGIAIASVLSDTPQFIFGANTSAMDMNTMIVCYGAPEWFRTVAMYAEMGRFYGLPSWGTGGCSDARVINAQAGIEAYEGILLSLLSSSTMVHDVGFLGHGEVYHPGMLVLTREMIRRARFLLKEPDLSAEALAIDVIDSVSRDPDSLYLAHQHSARHFRDALWLPPRYFEKGYMEDWDANRFQDQLMEEARGVLAAATPDLLDAGRSDEIDRYLRELPAGAAGSNGT